MSKNDEDVERREPVPQSRREFLARAGVATAGAIAAPIVQGADNSPPNVPEWMKVQGRGLTPNEVYAVSAYVLFINGIVSESATLDAASLAKVRMPNREGFTSPDPRPDTP
jgi:hypothetical protein